MSCVRIPKYQILSVLSDESDSKRNYTTEAALVCTSPPRSPQLGAPFEVSLNNQDYTASNLTFSTYPPPTVALLTPDRGICNCAVPQASLLFLSLCASGRQLNKARGAARPAKGNHAPLSRDI